MCSSVYVVQLVCVCVWYAIYGYGSQHDVYDAMKWFPPHNMYVYISCVGLCVHVFMNPMPSRFVCIFSDVLTYCVMLQAFICYCSYVSYLWCMCVCACVCVCVRVCVCVCVVVVIVHWHCSAQLSMFNIEKRYRNKTIIIIIIKGKLL